MPNAENLHQRRRQVSGAQSLSRPGFKAEGNGLSRRDGDPGHRRVRRRDKRIRSMRILELSASLPIVVEVVDLAERIAAALPVVEGMVNEGLVLIADVQVIKYGREHQSENDQA